MNVTEVNARLVPSCLLVMHSYCVQSPVNATCVRACMCVSSAEVSILIVVLGYVVINVLAVTQFKTDRHFNPLAPELFFF